MKRLLQMITAVALMLMVSAAGFAEPARWEKEWPDTDFSKSTVSFSEIISGGPRKDGIPAINNPQFTEVSKVKDLGGQEPVIALVVEGQAKAYPLRILMWHEIANDELGGVPVAVTYCPLCNAAVVFDRRVGGQVLDFGVSGKLRHSDMVMYDRQTESWWQQFIGKGIVGEMAGMELTRLPARVMPFSVFKEGFPQGGVLATPNTHIRSYGTNPYTKYDSSGAPFLYKTRYEGPGSALSYIVAVEKDAWLLADLRKSGVIEHNDLRLEWREGMNSALDTRRIDHGRDIGYIQVQRRQQDGSFKDIPYDTTFAFAFRAFHPEGEIHKP